MTNILTGNFVEDALTERWEFLAYKNMFGVSRDADDIMHEFIKDLADNGVSADMTAGEIIDDIVINHVIIDLTDADEVAQYEDPLENALFVTSDSRYAIIN